MKLRATLIGFTAILMWSILALLTAASGTMPPFQLSAICFAIGSIPGIVVLLLNPSRLALLKQPAKVWVTGIAGLFGYHFLYFTAIRNAPAVEAGLIAYLWPLLIVVGSALLPGERLRWYHVAGALAGLCGTFLIVGRNGIHFDGAYAVGYGAAFYAWDYGVKNGDIQILGAASYAAPLLSTLNLTLFGFAEPSWRIALACVLVTGGAVLAANEMFRRKATLVEQGGIA